MMGLLRDGLPKVNDGLCFLKKVDKIAVDRRL